jgi:hypothetical protein
MKKTVSSGRIFHTGKIFKGRINIPQRFFSAQEHKTFSDTGRKRGEQVKQW